MSTSEVPATGTQSIWSTGTEIAQHPQLEHAASADVCVVGAGIAGLTAAYLLSRAGHSVLVVDDGEIGGGETSRTTAHLTHALDDRYFELERLHGADAARLAADSHTRAIDEIETILGIEQIDCDFERVDGYLFLEPTTDPRMLDRELEAAHRAGLSQVERLEGTPVTSLEATGPCLGFAHQAQFHPLKYVKGLAHAIETRGGRIYARTHVTRVQGGAVARVETSRRCAISADAVVVATNTPVNDRVTIHAKQAAYRTYVVAMSLEYGSVPHALYWDTADPYHYLRVHRIADDRELLIVGGEDHKTGQAEDANANAGERFERLASWARGYFPMAGEVSRCWSGQIMEPVDGLAFIGRNPGDEPNVYIATGFSGNGMTHGTIAGMLICDLILGRENPWARVYDPSRFRVRAAPELVKENVDAIAHYAEYLGAGEIASADELTAGRGALVRRGLKMLAVYRDEHGALHELSAKCPHLGCVVGWNPVERTWDCPCHGSRFDPHGRMLNGPANVDLAPA